MSKEFTARFELNKGLVLNATDIYDTNYMRVAQNVILEQYGMRGFNPAIVECDSYRTYQDGNQLWMGNESNVKILDIETNEVLYTRDGVFGRWFFLPWGSSILGISTTGQYVFYNGTEFDDFTYTFPIASYWTVLNGQLFYVQGKRVSCSAIGQFSFVPNKENEAGSIDLPTICRGIEVTGGRLFAFCVDGIYEMGVKQQALGYVFYKSFVLANENSLFSDTRRILMVDVEGRAIVLWFNGESQTLGYAWCLGTIVDIFYSPHYSAFFIRNEEEETFILNDFGMTTTDCLIYGTYETNDGQIRALGKTGSGVFKLESQWWEFAQTSLKLLRHWELLATLIPAHQRHMSVYFNLQYNTDKIVKTRMFPLFPNVRATPQVTTRLVQFCLMGPVAAIVKLNHCILRWQYADKTQIRGADSASSTNTQAS